MAHNGNKNNGNDNKDTPASPSFDELADWLAAGSPELVNSAFVHPPLVARLEAGLIVPPFAEQEPALLGSRSDGQVVLYTGLLDYTESLTTLAGRMPLLLALHYIDPVLSAHQNAHKTNNESTQPQSSHMPLPLLGPHWRLPYQTTFTELQSHNALGYRLTLANGQLIDFIYESSSNKLIDTSEQGIRVNWQEMGPEAMADIPSIGGGLPDNKRFTLTYPNGDQHTYQDGYLLYQQDRHGNRIDLSYNARGQLVIIANHSGAQLTLKYQGQRLDQIHDQSDRAWHFAYNKAGHLINLRMPDGGVRHYHYQAFNIDLSAAANRPIELSAQHTSKTNPITATKTPYIAPQLIQINDTQKSTPRLTISYYRNGQVCQLHQPFADKPFRHYHYQLEQAQVQVSSCEEVNHKEANHTEANSKEVNSKETVATKKTVYQLSEYGLINRIHDHNDFSQYHTWDTNDRILLVGDCNGLSKSYHYDNQNRLTLAHTDEGKTQYHYQANNTQPSRVSAPEGVTLYQYKIDTSYTQGDMIQKIDPHQVITDYQYDEQGNLTEITDSEGRHVRLIYNHHQQLTEQTDLTGTVYYEYDLLGRLSQLTDAQGRHNYYHYHTNDQISKIGDDDGQLSFDYNGQGQLHRVTNPLGYNTQYRYDSQGHIAAIQNPDKQQKHFHYQGAELVGVTRGDGSQIQFKQQQNPSAEVAQTRVERIGDLTTEYHFDEIGRLIGASNADSTLRFHYDQDGQLDTQHQNHYSLHTAYRKGKRKNLSYLDQQLNYQHDKAGRLTGLRHNDEPLISQTWNSKDQLVERHYPNSQQEKYHYSAEGELEQLHSGPISLVYQRDASGLIKQKMVKKSSLEEDNENKSQHDMANLDEQDLNSQHDYDYDHAGRLIRSGKQHYYYDRLGNRTHTEVENIDRASAETGSISSTSINTTTKGTTDRPAPITWHYDPASNQLLSNDTHRFSYDARGNLINKTHLHTGACQTYAYNAKNQLTAAQVFDDNHSLIQQHYKYDPLGRRIEKRVTTEQGDTCYQYVYDGLSIVAILISQIIDGTQSEPHLVSITHDDATDTPLHITSKAGTFYYHRDHQGSIIALSDEQGRIVETLEYDNSFGELIGHEKQLETFNPYGYTGRELDAADLYYYRSRYYDPSIGRFLSQDPIEYLSGDANFYAYVGNDPINYIDPLGYKRNCLSPNTLKKVTDLAKDLGKKLGKAMAKRVATTMASLATGPGAILVAVANVGLSLWDLYSAKDEILDLYDTLKNADLDFSDPELSMGTMLGNMLDGKSPVRACPKNSTNKPNNKGGQNEAKKKNKENECKQCKQTAARKPVIFTGAKILVDELELDFTISGPMPLVWQRSYYSDNPNVGLYGQGWTSLADSHLRIESEDIVFVEPNGRELHFDHLAVGEHNTWITEQLTLSRPSENQYQLTTGDHSVLTFIASKLTKHLNYRGEATRFLIGRVADNNGNGLDYYYDQAYANTLERQEAQADKQARTVDQHHNQEHSDYSYDKAQSSKPQDRLTHIKTEDGRVFQLHYLDTPEFTRLVEVNEICRTDVSKIRGLQYHQQLWVKYQYNDQGDLIRVTNRAGRITREYAYENHMMVMHRVPDGIESHYQYNQYSPNGKVIVNHINTGEQYHFSYAPGQTSVIDHAGRETVYYFDDDDYHTGTLDALGQSTKKILTDDGLPEKIIDEAGNEKSFIYDGRGNPIIIKDIDGSNLQVSYHDDYNLPVEITDDLGNSTHFDYDEQGNLVKETQADGSTTQYCYNSQGLPTSIIDALGGENQFQYDQHANLTQRTDCSKQSTHYQYDEQNNLTQITDALGNQTHYQYDEEFQLTQITYPDRSQEHFQYNPQGQLTCYTNPAGEHTHYQLDKEGRPTQRTDSLGGKIRYHYDPLGRLSQLTTENNASYQFDYDPLDRLIKEQNLDGLTTAYQYDAIGNVIEKIEGLTGENKADTGQQTEEENNAHAGIGLRKTRYQRSSDGKLLEKHIAQGELRSRTRYRYDTLGQLTQARNQHSRVDLAYDPLGRLLSETTTTETGQQQLSHQYDLLGNRIATLLPTQKHLKWLYYGSGHLHIISLDDQVVCDYERDKLHRETYRSQGALHSTQAYDSLSRLTEQRTVMGDRQGRSEQLHTLNNEIDSLQSHLKPHKSTLKQQRHYQYSSEGELLQINDHRQGVTRYQYDPLGRILQAQHESLNEQFNFDPAHNLIPVNQEQNAVQNDTQNTPETPTLASPQGYIKNNRLVVFEDKRYRYDDFGNMIEKRIGKHTLMHFSYDAEHQLREAIVTKNGVTQTYTYSYDPFGRRIAKQDSFNTTYFVWDGNRLLSETRASRTKTYVYEQDGFTPVAQLIDYAQSDTQNARSAANSELLYYHCGHLGTPKELSDVQGNLVWSAQYKAWGNTLKIEYPELEAKAELETKNQISHTESDWPTQRENRSKTLIQQWQNDFNQALRFQGQYFDEETGLHYNRFRYYDPDVGRFTTQDPIGLLGGDNLYQYAPNPMGWVDPLGLAPKYRITSNTAGSDTLARGVHVNVKGPGLPNTGGHIGLRADSSGKEIILEPADSATDKMNNNQWNKACSCAITHISNPNNASRLAKQAQSGIDHFPNTNRADEMLKVKSILEKKL